MKSRRLFFGVIITLLSGLVLVGGCTKTVVPLAGFPAANGMVIVVCPNMEWIEPRTFIDERHYLTGVGCELQPVREEEVWDPYYQETIEGVKIELDLGIRNALLSSEDAGVFVFSDLQPGPHRLVAFRAIHRACELNPDIFRYTFPPDEFPELSLVVSVAGIAYVGEVSFSARHEEDRENAVLMHKAAKGTKFSLSRHRERDTLKALLKSYPEGPWTTTLRARVIALEKNSP